MVEISKSQEYPRIPFVDENGETIYLDLHKAEGKALQRIKDRDLMSVGENPIEHPLEWIDDVNLSVMAGDNLHRKRRQIAEISESDWQEVTEIIDFLLAAVKALKAQVNIDISEINNSSIIK